MVICYCYCIAYHTERIIEKCDVEENREAAGADTVPYFERLTQNNTSYRNFKLNAH
jgi:hypothetical protein